MFALLGFCKCLREIEMKHTVCLASALTVATLAASAFDVAKLQNMIDEASAKGGGTVVVPAGTWETGPIALKSNVTLHLDKGATLLGDTDLEVYRKAKLSALIHTVKAENVAIEGEGTIDGRSGLMPTSGPRPHLVNFFSCRNVRVEGVTLRCGGSWTLNPYCCDGVVIRGIRIWSHVNHCNDGIDISSKNVLIEDCEVDADDDALVFKTPKPGIEVENVIVRNCRLRSSCNAIKFGTESHGLMRNVRVSDCVIGPPSAQGRFDWRNANQGITNYLTGLAGIAVECVDGETLENVTVSGITMTGMQTPIFVRLGRRNPPRDGREACLRNVLIENVTATAESRIACSVTGVPGLRPQGVTIRNVNLTLPGGGTAVDAATPVPEVENGYPDAHMFHGLPLPAYGFYIRHADGVRLENVVLKTLSPDARPAVGVDDADVVTDLAVCRVDEAAVRERQALFLKSLERDDGLWFLPPAKNGAKPPLFVGLGTVGGKLQDATLAECRRRGWAMLLPSATEAKGVLAAIDAVAGDVDLSRVYLKGDGPWASLALETVAAAPTRFAGVSAVMPLKPVTGLGAARGTPVDLVAAMKRPEVACALDAFADLTGAKLPEEAVAAMKKDGSLPASFRFKGVDSDFPKKARPLAYRAEAASSRLSVTDQRGVSMFGPCFTWLSHQPPRSTDDRHRLILVGDSTLQHRSATSKAGSWGEALGEFLSDRFDIVNCAIGGRSTKTYMPEWLTNTVSRIRPGDWVIVQFGHNDMSKASDPKVDRQTDPDSEYMNNLRRFVADVRWRGGQPLLVTSVSLYLYNKDPNRWPERNPLARWVAAMKRVAAEMKVPLVDLNALTLAAVRDAGSEVSSKWYMFSEDGKDWAHPTKLGAKTFARLFADDVRASGHPAGKILRRDEGTETALWQAKIDAVSRTGGGRVVVPPGVHTVANLTLKDGVELHLEAGAVLQGSTNGLDYGYPDEVRGLPSSQPTAVVRAIGATNVAVTGSGVIDGRGQLYDRVLEMGKGRYPKKLRGGWGCLRFYESKGVRVEGVTLKDPVTWTCWLHRCEDVTLRGVTVRAHANWNNDGIDLQVRNALVENCDIDSEDDALVFKTVDAGWESTNVTVRGCVLSSCASFLKFGTETKGAFRHYDISDCRLLARLPSGIRYGKEAREPDYGRTTTAAGAAGSGGIVVAMVDGGQLEDVRIRGIEIGEGVAVPLFVRLGRRNPAKAYPVSYLRNVTIEDVRMTAPAASRVASSVTGVPGMDVTDVTLRNVSLVSPGGGTAKEAAASVREAETLYPSAISTFKSVLPAYGLFTRHTQGLKLENVTCRTLAPDARPEFANE